MLYDDEQGQYWGCLAAQLDAARLSHFECWGRERVGEERLREVTLVLMTMMIMMIMMTMIIMRLVLGEERLREVMIIVLIVMINDDHDDCCESGERERRGEGGGRPFFTLRFSHLPSLI